MKKHRRLQAALLCASLFTGAAAISQAPPDPAVPAMPGEQVAPTFESVDINQDGLISEQEATSARAMTPEAFAAIDADQDGYLSRDEFDQGA